MRVMGCNSIPPSRTSSQGPEVCGLVGTSPREWAFSKNSWMTRPKGIKTEGVGMNPNIPQFRTMPLTPAHISQASNVAVMPVTDSVPMDIDVEDPIAKAMAAAQEQLCVVMEAQTRDRKRREFTELCWCLQRIEGQKTQLLDREAAMEACSAAIMVVEARVIHVSVFLYGFCFGS